MDPLQDERTSASPRWELAVVVVAAAIAAGLTIAATRSGANLEPDSTTYLSAGINLAHGRGLVTLTGSELTVFPPGISLVAAAFERLGIDPRDGLRFVNAACSAVTVFLAWSLVRRCVQRTAVVVGATVAAAVSPALFGVTTWIMSEPLYDVVALSFLLAIQRVGDDERDDRVDRWFVTSVALVWVGFMFRYAGVVLVPVGAIVLAARATNGSLRSRARRAAWFVLAASAVPAAWVIRNLAVDGTPFGPRHRGIETIRSSARELAATIGSWVIGSGSGGRAAVAIGAVAVLGAGAATVYAARRGFIPLLAPAALVVLYAGYVVLVAWQSALDPIDDRLLAPVFVPMVVVVAWGAEQLLRRCSRSWSVVVAVGVSAALVGVLVIEARDDRAFVKRSSAGEVGLAMTRDHDAALARTVERVDPAVVVVSNDPYRLWVASGREPVQLAPAHHLYRSTEVQHQIPQLLRTAACRSVMLAWFEHDGSSFVSPEELRDHLRTELVDTGDGWALYRLGPVGDRGCSR